MNKQSTDNRKEQITKLIAWGIINFFAYLAFRDFYSINILPFVGLQNIWDSRRFLIFIFVVALSILFSLICAWYFIAKNIKIKLLLGDHSFIRNFFVALLLILPGVIKWLMPLPENFSIGLWMEIFLIIFISILINSFIFGSSNTQESILRIAAFILLAGAGHSIFYKFSQVSDHPFSLYWSEGNRFFDYSTLFGSFRYNIPAGYKIKAFISWGMQFPWALPFVIPNLSIGFFRFWYQLMWILPALLLGFVIIDRKENSKKGVFYILAFSLWAYLFLDQGPIYAPLVFGAILTVIAVKLKLAPGVILLMAAAYYTRNARWTWAYAPGLWAGMLALGDIHEFNFDSKTLKALIKPVVLGIGGYLGGHLIPIILKSVKTSADINLLPNPTASTSRQPLLWERLLPNPTYPAGILISLLWATLPLLILLAGLLITKMWRIKWPQGLAFLGICSAFLTVGIIASVKIGGGSNLHNLDMYLVTLLLIAGTAINRVWKHLQLNGKGSFILQVFMIIAMLGPVSFNIYGGERLSLPQIEKTSEALAAVQNKVSQFSTQGEVLFIDQRQLITFGYVPKIRFIDDYEKKYLMDQAMASNAKYFSEFYRDLADQRFVLIVNEPTNLVLRGSEYSFGEENDAYVKWVTQPLLCAYEPIYTSREAGIELLVPRKTKLNSTVDCSAIESTN